MKLVMRKALMERRGDADDKYCSILKAGVIDRSRLHPEKRQGKDGVFRTYWVSNGNNEKSGHTGANIRQTYTSARTSLKNNYPSVFKDKRFIQALVAGNENFDIGAGRTNIPTQILKRDYGIENVVFDPFNRDTEVNRKAVESIKAERKYPTVTVANVLNVIDNPESRSNVILQAAKRPRRTAKRFSRSTMLGMKMAGLPAPTPIKPL